MLDLIDKSEIFQLLWSKAAKRSPNVRKEWEHALGLHRDFFIGPAYWEKPMPAPPRELADIHFAYLELKDRGARFSGVFGWVLDPSCTRLLAMARTPEDSRRGRPGARAFASD